MILIVWESQTIKKKSPDFKQLIRLTCKINFMNEIGMGSCYILQHIFKIYKKFKLLTFY